MKTRKKKQLTLYDVITENRRFEEDLRILRTLVKEKKERWHQHHKVQPRTLTVGVGAALGACGAIAAGIRPFPRRNIDLTAIVL
jgi:hypothetical protein